MLSTTRLFSVAVALGVAIMTASAATTKYDASQITPTSIDHAVQTFGNEKDNIFIKLMDVGKRCFARDEICRFYYRGYYYETPWWTAPEIY